MKKYAQRRRLSGLVVDGKALLRFSVPFLILIVSSMSLILIMHWQLMNALVQIESKTGLDPQIESVVTSAISRSTAIGLMGIAVLGLCSLGGWLLYSHRIFGTMIPFRRHILNLIEKKYDSRVRLRRRDEFKDLAQDLNRLAESLGMKEQ